ncbi:MarR family winged helix-turn-helix transcriptional regulator [uncultured Flavonifractor sp.]|uniref:MarR family winged helix-turn-helix transcriptional regulator n=1 Tax=uncultured Flavonifractor sp. TaxID=1193534 RepID=UPI002632F92C|nr:MarR family winged helix-turn-helix transcriptional regulator [uncultured Flavonifractor sp.]
MEQGREMLNRFFTDLFDRFQRAEAGFLSGADLSPQEARLLEAVCRAVDGGLDNRSAAIAAERRVTAGTLTAAVKLLEKKGYLTRRRDERDRRVVRLTPTELGRRASEKYAAFRKRVTENAIAALTEDETAAFARAVEKLSQAVCLAAPRAEIRGETNMEGTI